MYKYDEDLTAEEFNDRVSAIIDMSKSNGWAEIKARLEHERETFLESLLEVPAIAENLGEISRLQAQANGCLYVLKMVENYTATAEGETNE